MIVRAMIASRIARCPKLSMLPAHYREDGSCECDHLSENLMLLKIHEEMTEKAEAQIRRLEEVVALRQRAMTEIRRKM